MKGAHFLVRSLLGSAMIASSVASEDVVPFDLENPPLPEPGKSYKLVIEPGKDAKPIALLFISGKEVFGQEDGKAWTTIESIVQEGFGELPFESQGGVPNLDIADFDGDGYRDLRVIAGWGSGGSWYNYYRFDGTKFISWKEPEELGISLIDAEKSYACAFWRMGPTWAVRHYRIEDGRFVFYEREIYDEADEMRAHVPSSVPDSHYVLITETIEGERVVHRSVVVRNPWDDDADAKEVFDDKVDEPLDTSRDE